MNQFLAAAFASAWPGCSMQGLGGQLGGTEIRSAAEAARIAYSDHSLSKEFLFVLAWGVPER